MRSSIISLIFYETSIFNKFRTYLTVSENPVQIHCFSSPINTTGPLYTFPFDPVHHYHSNNLIKNQQLLSPTQQQRVAEIGLRNREARRNGCVEINRDNQSPLTGWEEYDFTRDLEGETGFVGQLLSCAAVLPNQFDYIDIGSKLRLEYMLPNGPDYIIHPEPWQLQMFSHLKNNKSLVVIAPTSSGKTMSAEYAMRIAANSSGRGIGVFVLPTNALVRQAYATLCDDQYVTSRKVAMFTSERRDNFDADNYKVLVTNPQCLHLLINSKSTIFQRIQWVVIDEVHCIGASSGDTDGNGAVIERLLCMLQCPVVCLSATLANAHQFIAWLRALRSSQGQMANQNVEIIDHPVRSTALHYYSLGFDSQTQQPQEVSPKLCHNIGPFDLRLNFDVSSTSVLTGEWILSLPGGAFDQARFFELVSSQEMSLRILFASDNENTFTNSFDVKLLSSMYESKQMVRFSSKFTGDTIKGIPFEIDFTAPSITVFIFLHFEFDMSMMIFQVVHPETESVLLEIPITVDDFPLFSVSSASIVFSTTKKYYQLKSIRGYVKQNYRPLTIHAYLDPNAIPEIQTVDLNSLSFLSRISYTDRKSLSSFLSAAPSLQPHHVVETFRSLLHHISPVDVMSLFSTPTQFSVPPELLDVYEQLARDTFDPTDPHSYASYRARYTSYLGQLHDIVANQDSLIFRLLLDTLMSSIFARSNADWYGKLYYMGPVRIPFLQSINWDQELLDAKQSIMSSDISNAFVSCLRRSSNPVAFYADVYLRNIFALDTSFKYVLTLFLPLGNEVEESTGVPVTIRQAVISALSTSNTSRLQMLQQITPRRDLFTLRSNQVISIIRHFMALEENPVSKEVQAPTLLFHFSKKGIDEMVSIMLEHQNLWFGDRSEGHFLSESDLERLGKFLPNQIRDIEKRALMLGIGMHYRVSKENQDYLEEVEYLFQSRKLKFVFATGSLSYGINMPAANVIFLGGSPFLNGLLLRQCAGRAGRRGYGAGVGKVYFVGLGTDSIIRKMCMPLDELRPQLAITPSYLLSSSILHSTCDPRNKDWIEELILRTLTQPLYKHLITSPYSRKMFDSALAHSCFFTWSFLNQRGYLQPSGLPSLKCDLQYRLDYLAPQCFILTELLTECVDPTLRLTEHTLCDLVPDSLVGTTYNSEIPEYLALEKAMLSLLNHLLSLSGTVREREYSEIPLSPVIKEVWDSYTTTVTTLFLNYLRGIGAELVETYLPLGDTAEGFDYRPHYASPIEFDHLVNYLRTDHHLSVPLIRSVFSALSTADDTFKSVSELMMSAKDGLFISDSIIPSRDYPQHVHIRVEHVYYKQTFSGLREKYQDVDAESSCENFSRAIRCVRAFLQKLLTSLDQQSLAPKAIVLFQTIITVVNKFEKSLAIARGLGKKLYGRVVEISRSSKVTVEPIESNGENSSSFSIFIDGGCEVGDIISYYAIMSKGRIVTKFPEIVEELESRRCRGTVVDVTMRGLKRGEVQDEVTQKRYPFYKFHLDEGLALGRGQGLSLGTKVDFNITVLPESQHEILVAKIQVLTP